MEKAKATTDDRPQTTKSKDDDGKSRDLHRRLIRSAVSPSNIMQIQDLRRDFFTRGIWLKSLANVLDCAQRFGSVAEVDMTHRERALVNPPVVDADGCVALPQGPGLGVEIDRDLVA